MIRVVYFLSRGGRVVHISDTHPLYFWQILVTVHLKDFFYLVYKEYYMEEIKISLILHARI